MSKLFEKVDVIVASTNSTQLVVTNLTGHPSCIVPNGLRGDDAPAPPAVDTGDDDQIGGPGTPVSHHLPRRPLSGCETLRFRPRVSTSHGLRKAPPKAAIVKEHARGKAVPTAAGWTSFLAPRSVETSVISNPSITGIHIPVRQPHELPFLTAALQRRRIRAQSSCADGRMIGTTSEAAGSTPPPRASCMRPSLHRCLPRCGLRRVPRQIAAAAGPAITPATGRLGRRRRLRFLPPERSLLLVRQSPPP